MESILSTSRKHDITFHASGRIDISARIARKLSLVPGDVIDIRQSDGGEWYIYVKHRAGNYAGCYQGTVWATVNGRGTYRAHCKAITRFVLAATKAQGRLRCPCGTELEIDNAKHITIIYRCSL